MYVMQMTNYLNIAHAKLVMPALTPLCHTKFSHCVSVMIKYPGRDESQINSGCCKKSQNWNYLPGSNGMNIYSHNRKMPVETWWWMYIFCNIIKYFWVVCFLSYSRGCIYWRPWVITNIFYVWFMCRDSSAEGSNLSGDWVILSKVFVHPCKIPRRRPQNSNEEAQSQPQTGTCYKYPITTDDVTTVPSSHCSRAHTLNALCVFFFCSQLFTYIQIYIVMLLVFRNRVSSSMCCILLIAFVIFLVSHALFNLLRLS